MKIESKIWNKDNVKTLINIENDFNINIQTLLKLKSEIIANSTLETIIEILEYIHTKIQINGTLTKLLIKNNVVSNIYSSASPYPNICIVTADDFIYNIRWIYYYIEWVVK